MILQQFYEQKKAKIDQIINRNRPPGDQVRIGLFNDRVFSTANNNNKTGTFPVVMFKYDEVIWNTSSEKEYKADVHFCIYIVLDADFNDDYLESFELARQIDEAILLNPTGEDIRLNKIEVERGITDIELITNATFKVREGQYTVEEYNWEKNNFYIWEMSYKTTLIERTYKKRYTMISNEFFTQEDLDDTDKRDQLAINLKKIGYDLNDYYVEGATDQKYLVLQNIDEKIQLLSPEELKDLILNPSIGTSEDPQDPIDGGNGTDGKGNGGNNGNGNGNGNGGNGNGNGKGNTKNKNK